MAATLRTIPHMRKAVDYLLVHPVDTCLINQINIIPSTRLRIFMGKLCLNANCPLYTIIENHLSILMKAIEAVFFMNKMTEASSQDATRRGLRRCP